MIIEGTNSNSWKFQELYHFKWLFFILVQRDIKLRYRQTYLGVVWVVIQPILTAVMFSALFGKILHFSTEKIPYFFFTFCGLIPWIVFSQSLHRANSCLTNDIRLITKVYFPRIFLPLSATFGVFIDYLVTLFLAFFLLIFFKIPFSTHLFFLPICTILLFLFSSGVNLFFSSLNVYYRDVKHMIPFLLQIGMYASPLIYSSSIIPEKYQWLYLFNPLVGIIDLFRWTLLDLSFFPMKSFMMAIIASMFLFGMGTMIFQKIEKNFADII